MDLNSVIMLSSPEQKKKKKEFVTIEQREAMFSFISDNPEMLTHSSTQENEQVLWKELTQQLNTLQPQKSIEFWKTYWKRWYSSLDSKPESSLTILEYRLKRFINQLGINVTKDEKIINNINGKKLTLAEISNKLNEIEKEKMELKLETDEVEIRILSCRKDLKELENNLKLKRRRNADLLRIKTSLNTKRRKMLEKENSTTTYISYEYEENNIQ